MVLRYLLNDLFRLIDQSTDITKRKPIILVFNLSDPDSLLNQLLTDRRIGDGLKIRSGRSNGSYQIKVFTGKTLTDEGFDRLIDQLDDRLDDRLEDSQIVIVVDVTCNLALSRQNALIIRSQVTLVTIEDLSEARSETRNRLLSRFKARPRL